MPSVFSERDPASHKTLKQPVASKYTMTSIRSFEPYADQCSDIFIKEMRAKAGQAVDLSACCQYYAFDAISEITFQHRFGFMEHGRDVDNMIAGIWNALVYGGIIGHIPEWYPWLMGNMKMMGVLERLGLIDSTKTPFLKIEKVSLPDRITDWFV